MKSEVNEDEKIGISIALELSERERERNEREWKKDRSKNAGQQQTTDSLPKLAKIKQDEKLSWCCRAIVGLLESQSSWSGITKILILRFDQKNENKEEQ